MTCGASATAQDVDIAPVLESGCETGLAEDEGAWTVWVGAAALPCSSDVASAKRGTLCVFVVPTVLMALALAVPKADLF